MLILWVRKCEYGVLEITRDTKVLSSHSSSTRDLRLLYHLWFPKPHTHISYSQYLHIVVNYIDKKTLEQISMYYYGEGVNIMVYCYICKKKVNVVTCESIDFCSHMWLHWLLNIMFCSSFCVLLSFHKIFNRIFFLFVFNFNANTVRSGISKNVFGSV